jgi:hypothetical protein
MSAALAQGLSPVIPVTLIILVALLSIFIAWWSYQYLQSISSVKKVALILLRASSLLILLTLLLNPFYSSGSEEDQKPKIAVYLDNSQSTTVTRGSYEGIEEYQGTLARFRANELESYDYDYYLFDGEINASDQLTGDGFRTDLFEVLNTIRENETEYSASVIFSDGIVTMGRDPVFAAQNISTPVITIPVGDTTSVRDIAVADVNVPQTVYTQTTQTFTAEIQQRGFEGEEVSVQLIRDGVVEATRNIRFSETQSSRSVEFEQTFREPGFVEYEVFIAPRDEEFTEQNNRYGFTVDVLEEKTRILSIAFEVHPDVGAIRNVIATDQQNELIPSTYLRADTYAETDPMTIEDEIDLLVLHGLPPVNSNAFQWVQNQNKPTLFFTTPTSFERLMNNRSLDLVGYRLQDFRSTVTVRLSPFQSTISHPLLEMQLPPFRRMPSLESRVSNYRISAIAERLIEAQPLRMDTRIPVLIAESTGSQRKASVNAYGWYKFQQSTDDGVRQFYRSMMTNLISWASTPPDREMLEIEPVQPVFSENEEVRLRATLRNERGEPEPDAVIEVELSGEESAGQERVFRMTHRNNELYEVQIGTYPQGVYRIQATATKEGRTLGSASTRVEVSQSSEEFLDTRRNDALLRQIAQMTRGYFAENSNMESVSSFLQELDLRSSVLSSPDNVNYIYRSAIWFFVVLLLLAAEWILRRTVSLP